MSRSVLRIGYKGFFCSFKYFCILNAFNVETEHSKALGIFCEILNYR